MALDVLDGVVAGVGIERVDGVHAVLAVAPAIAALEDLHVHPVGLAAQAREGDDLEVADAGGHLPGHGLRQRLHHRVGKLVAGREAGDDRGGEDRVGEAAARGDDGDRPGQAGVLGM
jgi:hypothetical protein